jgi:uncharacterized protein (DUF1684 family)
MISRRLLAFTVLAATAAVPCAAQMSDADHVKAVAEWRAKHEADYKRDWIPLAGLFFLQPGDNSAGSASTSRVRLPERLPASIGRFIFRDGHVTFEPQPGAPVTLRGQPVTSALVLRSDVESPVDQLAVGDLTLWVHDQGERKAIRMRDPQGEGAKTFTGFKWFPIDGRYRVVGTFIKDPAPRQIKMDGDDEPYTSEGVVEFTLDGQKLRLRPMTTRPGRLFFVIRDATSGKETYEAARMVYSDLRPDGTTILDFNEAYNPPCAFNPFTTCPLPLPENRLTVRIAAGEMKYTHPE